MVQFNQPAQREYPAGFTDKSLPYLPIFSIDSDQLGGQEDDQACPSPTVRKYEEIRISPRNARSRVPQFQQSKRWARLHSSGRLAPIQQSRPSSPIEAPSTETEDQVLTMREASFEQQRATKKPLALKSAMKRPVQPRIVSDSSAEVQDGGLCRSALESVKATVIETPQAASKRWLGKSTRGRRKVTPTRHREVKFRRTADTIAVPSSVRVGHQSKSKRPVTMPKSVPLVPEHLQASQDMALEQEQSVKSHQQRSPSPVPSLHDPEKDSRFSQECQDLLKSMNFNEDWLLPAASISHAVGTISQPGPSILSSDHKRIDSRQTMSIKDALHRLPPLKESQKEGGLSDLTPSAAGSPIASRKRPAAPTRASSKTVASLASMLHMTFPKLTSAHSDSNPESASASHVQLQRSRSAAQRPKASQAQLQRSASAAQRPRAMQSLLRLPSGASISGQTLRSPRSAMSVDTLSKIEAQVQNGPPFRINTGLASPPPESPERRSSGPPSIPPERPLPALPAAAIHDAVTVRTSTDSARSARKRSDARAPMVISPSTIRVVGESLPVEPSVSLQQSAGLQSPQARSAALTTPARHSADVSSLSSGNSRRSSRSFNRHSISGVRADKVKEKRLRDLASSKGPAADRPSSSDSAESARARQDSSDSGQLQNTTPPTSFSFGGPTPGDERHNLDQLDQFPAVPISRAGSVSGPTHSRGQSYSSIGHARQWSKESNTYARQAKPRQVLGQSNIFVVVDSDPVTARFRAGAMSPSPSIGRGAEGRSGSPFKAANHSRVPSNLREVTVNQGSPLRGHKRNNSIQAEKSDTSAARAGTPPRRPKRHARSNSIQASSSSDESTSRASRSGVPKSPHRHSHRSKKRRRWNSGDITLIKTLHNNLEDYYGTILKQEERIRWQADQLRMMIRVIAPMNRARGIKASAYNDGEADTDTGDEDDFVSQQYARRLSSGVRSRRQQKPRSISPQNKVSKDRLNRPAQRRYPSAGNNSTTSATASMSAHSTKHMADDASETDPFEYDGPLSGVGKVYQSQQVNKENQPPTIRRVNSTSATVSNSLPRPRLSEEMSMMSSSKYVPTITQLDEEDEEDMYAEEEAKRREEARLSVNHVLTNTDQMDKALEQFAYI
ncbi:hypothetical protein EDD37DRAFT_460682 [Exophiala viscosa]|uniref:uncharacterized protein n=1 Tax=Exophiala viscosa TaxID=2486360 RepID=UPI002191DB24|nr:hypothetical protein EDD37DRAFT_460682 [Exophiala viscosa]